MGGVKGGAGFKLNDVSPSAVGRRWGGEKEQRMGFIKYSFTSNVTSELLLLVEQVKQTQDSVWVELVFATGVVGGFPHPLIRASASGAEVRTAAPSTPLHQDRRRVVATQRSLSLTAPGLGTSVGVSLLAPLPPPSRQSLHSSLPPPAGGGEMTFPPHWGLGRRRDKLVSSRRHFRSSAERRHRALDPDHRPPLSGRGGGGRRSFVPVTAESSSGAALESDGNLLLY